uniref:Uncharacterized protein n=1 Tax=Peronospora matthiolae TaxID=2874970 RepID=A0AAV1TZJ2_9STRA
MVALQGPTDAIVDKRAELQLLQPQELSRQPSHAF